LESENGGMMAIAACVVMTDEGSLMSPAVPVTVQTTAVPMSSRVREAPRRSSPTPVLPVDPEMRSKQMTY
jgi:hypothetical protein